VAVAGAASAHVHLEPDSATQGGDATVSFVVPNEQADADTVKVEVQIPTEHPIGSVSVQAIAGWTSSVEKSTLATPIETDDGEITETVSKITWEGGTIAPDQFQEFTVSFDSLPDDVDSLVLKTVQTYSNGDVSRWIEEPAADGSEPEQPAPVLHLSAASASTDDHGHGAAAATTTTAAHDDEGSHQVAGGVTDESGDSGSTLGTIGIVVGGVALVVALIALFRRPRGAA
jgi:uncharacterized protein